MRTTVQICDILKLVNRRNRVGTQTPEQREGQNGLLESILHETGNYEGFGNLTASELPKGVKPGIRWTEQGPKHAVKPDFTDCDDSRRVYYTSGPLRKQASKRPDTAGSLGGIFKTMDLVDL